MVEIVPAKECDVETVKNITYTDVKEVYPKYYPAGAVQMFLDYHDTPYILKDIEAGCVYLLKVDGIGVGTVTIKENEVARLYLLPEYQHKGYGRMLFEFAESLVFTNYAFVRVDSSLPAKEIYVKRGYREIEYHAMDSGHGDYLCYDVMIKVRSNEPKRTN